MSRYGQCPESGISHPPAHGIAFAGTIVAAKPIDCGVQITVDVTRSSSPSLPAAIVIDIGACFLLDSGIGHRISAVVYEAPKQSGAYDASVYCDETR